MGVLLNEMSRAVRRFCARRSRPVAGAGLQYADYAVWQRKWMEGEVLQAAGGVLERGRWPERLGCWSCRRIIRGRRSRIMPAAGSQLELDEKLTRG